MNMTKEELLKDYKENLGEILEKIAYAFSGFEDSDTTLGQIKEQCESVYYNINDGKEYVYEDDSYNDDCEDEE